MQMIRLKNGKEEPAPAVAATMMSVKSLDPVALYELVQKCRDPEHKFWGDAGERLEKLALVQPGGRVHQTVKNTVLSAISGDGLDLTIGLPN